MHTTIGYAAAPTLTTEEFVDGAPDQHVRVVGDDIYIGKYNQIVAAMAMGHSVSYAKLESPSLRRVFSPFIVPKVSLAADSKDAWMPQDMSRNPLVLATNEALNAKMLVSEVHADHYNVVGINLAEGALATVSGPIHTLYIVDEGDVCPIGVWTNLQLTLGIDLPVGRYQVVGAQCFSNFGGLFRLVPIGEDYRPGGIMGDDLHPYNAGVQRMGNWGVWCEFDQLTPPSIDILPYKATGWFTLALDLIKV